MLEKRKKSVDNGKTFAALLTDLSKDSDCLPHDLIIAKLKPLLSGVPFLYPLKTSENHRFSGGFREYKKGTPGSDGLMFQLVIFKVYSQLSNRKR